MSSQRNSKKATYTNQNNMDSNDFLIVNNNKINKNNKIIDIKEIDFKDIFINDYNRKDIEIYKNQVKEIQEQKNENEDINTINENKKIEDKLNMMRIYNDLNNLCQLYQRNIVKNSFNKVLEDIYNNRNGYSNIEINFEKFDVLYKRIKNNLFVKIGNKTFSNIFFQNLKTDKLKFFIRFYMLRIFFAIKERKKDVCKFSIINIRNIMMREILSNIIKTILDIYYKFLPKNENTDEEENLMNNSIVGILKEKKEEEEEEEEILTKYFEVLFDFINFENTFLYHPVNTNINIRKNEDKNDNSIYNKYINYYGTLSANNNNNYSYIYEYKKVNNKNEYYVTYNNWNKYIKDEYENEGLKILYSGLEKNKYTKNKNESFGTNNKFYEMTFKYLDAQLKKEEKSVKEVKEKIKIINSIVNMIISAEENIFKYLKQEENKYKIIFKSIITSIIKKLYKNIKEKDNEILKEKEEEEKQKENIYLEYFNSLIILLESFGEHKNKYFLCYIFEKENENQPTVFEKLVELYEEIMNDLKDDEEYDNNKKNKLHQMK